MSGYRLDLEKPIERKLRKFDRQIVRAISETHFPAIITHHHTAGQRLTGPMRDFWSYHFHHAGTQYRIIYQIIDNLVLVIVIDIGQRDHVYDRLKKRV